MARRAVRPQGSKYAPVRSARIDDETWEKARRRANYEGVTMSKVMETLVTGYARGLINLPKVQVVYDRPKGGEQE